MPERLDGNDPAPLIPDDALRNISDDYIPEVFLGDSPAETREFLDGALRLALDPDFPTPDCLSPSEVAEYSRTEEISPAVAQHLQKCRSCVAMLHNIRLKQESLDEFLVHLEHERQSEGPAMDEPSIGRERELIPIAKAPASGARARNVAIIVGLSGVGIAAALLFFVNTGHQNSMSPQQEAAKISTSPQPAREKGQPAKANLVIASKAAPARKVVLPVSAHGQALEQESYDDAAAAAALFSSSKSPEPSTDLTILMQKSANALRSAGVATDPEAEDALGTAPTDNSAVNQTSAAKSDAKAICSQLSTEQNIIVTDGKFSCLVSLGDASLSIYPEAVRQYREYNTKLRAENGEVAAAFENAAALRVRVINGPVEGAPAPSHSATEASESPGGSVQR